MAMIRQEFVEESLSHTRKVQRQVKSKGKSMLIIFFDVKGIVHKESILAGQTVNSAYCCDIYGDCVNLATKELGVVSRQCSSF
jgi:hypothetical protein